MRVLFIFYFLIHTFCSQAQLGWNNINSSNGLGSNVVNDVLVESANSFWIATNGGVTHITSGGIASYNATNSTLNTNRIKELCLFNGNIYMTTDSGLTYFDGRQFINYTTQNGLLSNNLRGIDKDKLGNLWLGSPAGVSRFDGSQFHHFPGKSAFSIAVDTNNNVYIQKFTAIFNIPNAPASCEIYDGTNWFTPTPNFSFPMANSKFKRCRNGQMVIYGNNDDFYAELTYPYNLSPKSLMTKDSNLVTDVNLIEIDENSTLWMGRRSLQSINLFKGSNGVIDGFILQPLSSDITSIDVHDGIVLVGSFQGVFIANSSIVPVSNSETIETNELSALVDANGPLFYDIINNRGGFEYPKQSELFSIYGGQLMIAVKNQTDTAYKLYPENPLTPSFENGPVGSANNFPMFSKITRHEINSHVNNFRQPSYQPTANIVNWPVVGDTSLGQAIDLAAFVDVDGDNCYSPINGDYPFILGDEAIFWMNHPAENAHQLELHNMVYKFNSNTNPLDKTIFLRTSIINRSNVTYDSVKVGMYLDANIGSLIDDFLGCDSINNIAYFYNSDLFDETRNGVNGYGTQIPSVGFKFLSDSMSTHMRIGSGSGPTGTPSNPQDWINYLSAKWKDGTDLKYGGDGYNSPGITNTTTSFMYSGDPQNQLSWSEVFPGGSQGQNGLADRVSISSIPRFSLQPNQRKTIDIAFNVTQRTSFPVGTTVGNLISNLNNASIWYQLSNNVSTSKAAFINCSTVDLDEEVLNKDLRVFPNPAHKNFTVSSQTDLIRLIQVFDSNGSLIKIINTLGEEIKVNLNECEKGVYYLKLQLENGSVVNKKIVLI